MSTVRIGVSFDGFVTTGEALALAQSAVAAGAKSLWVAEHLGYREAIATCMAFALRAPGPMLVPTAVSPYLWHPMPTAMATTNGAFRRRSSSSRTLKRCTTRVPAGSKGPEVLASGLNFPGGFAAGRDAIYYSEWSIAPAENKGGPTGQVIRVTRG